MVEYSIVVYITNTTNMTLRRCSLSYANSQDASSVCHPEPLKARSQKIRHILTSQMSCLLGLQRSETPTHSLHHPAGSAEEHGRGHGSIQSHGSAAGGARRLRLLLHVTRKPRNARPFGKAAVQGSAKNDKKRMLVSKGVN